MPAEKPKKRRSIAFRLFLLILLFGGAAAGYLAVQGPGVIVDLARKILRDNGLPEVEFAVSRITLETVTLEGIRIGREGALKIPRISAVFTWRELVDGEVGEISIDGLELTVRQHAQGLSFGELDPFVYGASAAPEDGTSTTGFNWPFRKLVLGKARITLLDSDENLIVGMVIDGTVERAPGGGLKIGPARITATSPEIDLTAAITATITGDGALSAKMELEEATASVQGYDIAARDGLLELSTPLDNLSALESTGRLRVSEVVLPFGFATSGELDLSVKAGRLEVTVRAEDKTRGLSGALSIAAALKEPLAAQPVSIELDLSAADAARLPEGLLPIPLTQGAVDLRLSLADTVGNFQSLVATEGMLALAGIFPAVTLSVEAAGITSPVLPGTVDTAGTFRLESTEDGDIALFAPKGIRAVLFPADPAAWRALLGPLGQPTLGQPTLGQLTISKPADIPPLRLSMTAEEGSALMLFRPGEILQKSSFAGSFDLEGGALPALHAYLSASVIVDPQARIFDATVERLSLLMKRAALSGFKLTGVTLELTAEGTERGLSGTADMSARISGGSPNTVQISDAEIDIPTSWQYSPELFQLLLRDCATLATPEVQTGGVKVDLRGVRFCLRQAGTSLVQVVPPDGENPVTGKFNAALTMEGRDIVILLQDGKRIRIGKKGNRIAVNGGMSDGGAISLKTDAALGEVILPDALLRISDLRLSADAKDVREKLAVGLQAAITDLTKPFRFAPVDLTLDGTAAGLDAIGATGTAAMRGSPLKLEWDAEHNLSSNKGRATLRVLPFEFGISVNPLSNLTSLLQGIVSRPAGQLLGAASASWSNGAGCGNGDLLVRQASAVLTSSGAVPIPGEITLGQIGLTAKLCADETGITSQAGQLLLDGMAFEGEQVSAQSINANIDIQTFQPFATAPAQSLSVGVVDLGFPLTDGLATFTVTDTSDFALESLAFNWAGGTVSVAPLRIGTDTPLTAVDLSVDGAQLQKLTDLIPDKGVTGEGILDGKLPIRLTEAGPTVRKGYLEARGPGVLRYKSSLGEGQEASTVDDMLSNLQYSKLRMDIDGGLSGGVTIGLSVEGKNPDYLNGYPVVLEVNVNGPLGAIMNDGLATYKVPSQILERMRRFGQLQ